MPKIHNLSSYSAFMTDCPICGKQISNNARGRLAHCRAHVRKGEANMHKDRNGQEWFEKAEVPTDAS